MRNLIEIHPLFVNKNSSGSAKRFRRHWHFRKILANFWGGKGEWNCLVTTRMTWCFWKGQTCSSLSFTKFQCYCGRVIHPTYETISLGWFFHPRITAFGTSCILVFTTFLKNRSSVRLNSVQQPHLYKVINLWDCTSGHQLHKKSESPWFSSITVAHVVICSNWNHEWEDVSYWKIMDFFSSC